MLVCSLCDFRAFSKGNLAFHLSSVHFKDKEYICRLCHFKTAYKGALTRHVNTVHLRQCRTKECPICGYTTPSLLNLNSHLSSEHHLEIATAFAKPDVSRVRNAAQIKAEELAKHQLQMQQDLQQQQQQQERERGHQEQQQDQQQQGEERQQPQLGEDDQPLNLIQQHRLNAQSWPSKTSALSATTPSTTPSAPITPTWSAPASSATSRTTASTSTVTSPLGVDGRRRKTADPVRIERQVKPSFSEGEWALVKHSYDAAVLLQQEAQRSHQPQVRHQDLQPQVRHQDVQRH